MNLNLPTHNGRPPILFIGPYPPPYSGPELGTKLFLESELKDIFNLHFIKTNFRKSNVNKGRLDGQMVKAFFVFFGRLISSLIRYRPELVYYPITPTQIGWVGRDIWCLLISRLFGSKTVIHLRGGHLNLNFQTFHPLVKHLVKYACSSVSMALVQAECLRDQFSGLVPNERVKVLYNAIDTAEYINNTPYIYDHHKILFMGHLTQAKGYCDAVRAIPIVAKHTPNIQFYFAGTLRRGERGVFFNQTNGQPLTYEDPVKVHQEISSGCFARNYRYLGIVTGQEKIKLLKESNIFILPSYSEGFSRAVLEAMAMGKPIICTPVGALREILKDGENGFLIPPGDFRQLARRIIQLLEDPELRNRMAQKNIDHVRRRFTAEKISARLADYFHEVLT
ncbi:MAG: glycosyltransferase family 4 protein [bacterium]|nr:glycosyltransferase family 4 protein [bacterium]